VIVQERVAKGPCYVQVVAPQDEEWRRNTWLTENEGEWKPNDTTRVNTPLQPETTKSRGEVSVLSFFLYVSSFC